MNDMRHTILEICVFVIFISHHWPNAISIPNLHITKETHIHTYVQMLVRASYLGANNSCRI